MIITDVSNLCGIADLADISAFEKPLLEADRKLREMAKDEGSLVGWLNYPKSKEFLDNNDVSATAKSIRQQSGAVLVIGAGGSYLGARAVIEMLKGQYYNMTASTKLYFTGHDLSAREQNSLDKLLENVDFSIVVISKSGGTLEPALALRHYYTMLTERYGQEADKRVYAITDSKAGKLLAIANEKNWKTFFIPESMGGRYSVFSPVGILPMAIAGVDIEEFWFGTNIACEELWEKSMKNPAWVYAAARNILYSKGKKVELLACYEPSFRYFAEWWKQLFGESEGKNGRGIFPASVIYTTDLHSLGQYVQDGERTLFETLITFDSDKKTPVPAFSGADGLDYLEGSALEDIQAVTEKAVTAAHADGGVPVINIRLEGIDAYYLGALMYLLMYACALSSLLQGVDPFDQPGVEAYKANMTAMLKENCSNGK